MKLIVTAAGKAVVTDELTGRSEEIELDAGAMEALKLTISDADDVSSRHFFTEEEGVSARHFFTPEEEGVAARHFFTPEEEGVSARHFFTPEDDDVSSRHFFTEDNASSRNTVAP
jgi:hypothetical protein